MTRSVCVILACCWLLVCGVSALAATNEPVLVCENASFNFGSQPNTNTITHAYLLKNRGTVPVKIEKVWTGCGCVKKSLAGSTVGPGEEVALEIEMRLRNRRGKQRKSIYIHSTDPNRRILRLEMQGEAIWVAGAKRKPVVRPVAVSVGERKEELDLCPDILDLGSINEDQSVSGELDFKRNGVGAFHVTGVRCSQTNLVASVKEVVPGREFRIRVSMEPYLPVGDLACELTIETDSTNHPTINVPVRASIAGDIYSIPEEIILVDGGTAARDAVRYIRVASRKNRAFKVLDVTSPTVALGIVTVKQSPGYLLKIDGLQPNGDVNGARIQVKTDVAEGQATLSIPIRVVSRKALAAKAPN